jgi:regulator of RNase E activity RraA
LFFKRGGANGLVDDGYIRDYDGLSGILDYAVCSRGTSSVDSAIRWR